MKKVIVISLCMLSALASMAQSKQHILKGQVLDAVGKAVDRALIKIPISSDSTLTDAQGMFLLESENPISQIEVSKDGFIKKQQRVTGKTFIQVLLESTEEIAVPDDDAEKDCVLHDLAEPMVVEKEVAEVKMDAISTSQSRLKMAPYGGVRPLYIPEQTNSESYSEINENDFHYAVNEPLSTFSIDVDRAAYSNIRRFLNNGQLPPPDAVRIEEMINYFDYEYDSPQGKNPVKVFTEVSTTPWNKEHQLLHIGVKAKDLDVEKLPASNIVFLIDVSGSMNAPNKLPLLKSSMKMLVQQMRDEDKVAIVVYAGAAGLVLESTSGGEKQKIYEAIDNLSAGGSTAGGAGIRLAYRVAAENLIKDGNNRIVLATDGDFNVGASSDSELEKLITSKRNQGVYLTVLGFGMGNYKDSKMEILADKGNGNYAYIDNITEAKKTLVNEFGGTMFAVAKDVKIQIEFNPANVAEYRLIGYENRLLKKEDFNNDKMDAGEMGVGHVVTALYEIVPIGSSSNRVDPLKYQPTEKPEKPVLTDELATVKLRYKLPDSDKSTLMSSVVKSNFDDIQHASENLKWSASIAQFGMLLRDSDHKGETTYTGVIKLAESAKGKDKEGYRRECIQLMKSAEILEKSTTAQR